MSAWPLQPALLLASGQHSLFAVRLDELGVAIGKKQRPLDSYFRSIDSESCLLGELLNDLGIDDLKLVSKKYRVAYVAPNAAHLSDIVNCRSIVERSGIEWNSNCIVIDSAVASLLANLNSFYGACSFSSSSAAVFCGVKIFRAPLGVSYPLKLDGRAAPLGGFGAGDDIGLKLLQEIYQQYDWFGKEPDIVEAVIREMQVECVADLANCFERLMFTAPLRWRAKLSDLACLVTASLSENPHDRFCLELIEDAAKQMSDTTRRCLTANDAIGVDVVCQGGMFRHSQHYFDFFKSRIGTEGTCTIARRRPVLGGLTVALGDNWQPCEEDPVLIIERDFPDHYQELSYPINGDPAKQLPLKTTPSQRKSGANLSPSGLSQNK